MRYIGSLILVLFFLAGCNHPTKHLEHINKINGSIDVEGWEVCQSLNMGDEEFFSLKKRCCDTIFHLSFSRIVDNTISTYYIDNFYKVFKADDYYHQIALQNLDTLYSFRTRYDLSKNLPEIKNMEFSTGKYFFLYKMNKLTWEQRKFFEANKDSLIQVKGDHLPPLPEIDDSIDNDFILPEEKNIFENE